MIELKYRVSKLREKAVMKVAWALPHELAKWTYIRVVAHATTGQYENQVVPELTALDALDRWSKK